MPVLFDNVKKFSVSPVGQWTDIDLSLFLPSNAAVAIIQVTGSTTSLLYGIRAKGSVDDIKANMQPNGISQHHVKLDSNNIIQCYSQDLVLQTYLCGYYMDSEITCFTDRVQKNPNQYNQWETWTVSEVPTKANFAIFEITVPASVPTPPSIEFKMYGSLNNRNSTHNSPGGHHFEILVGLDELKRCEAFIGSSAFSIYLIGYIKQGINLLDAIKVNPVTFGDWEIKNLSDDIYLPARTLGIVADIWTLGSSIRIGMRPIGSTDYYQVTGDNQVYYGTRIVKIVNNQVELLGCSLCDFFRLGYFVDNATGLQVRTKERRYPYAGIKVQ